MNANLNRAQPKEKNKIANSASLCRHTTLHGNLNFIDQI